MTFVTPGYPPTTGGVEAHVGALSRELAELGWQVHVLTAQAGLRRKRSYSPHDRITVDAYPSWPVPSISLAPRLVLAALRRQSSTIVHVHSYHASTGLAMLPSRRSLVFTPHYHGGGHTRLAKVLHTIYRLLGRRMVRNADAIICVSDAEGRLLSEHQPEAAAKISVIPNGVDVGAVSTAEPFLLNQPTIVSLGRLEAYKRTDIILEAMTALDPAVRLEVLGDGPERESLMALSRRLGLDGRVTFHGFVDRDTANRWLRSAAVVVSASEHEAFGMAPVEAAAAGARLVLSNIDAHRELVTKYLHDRACLVDTDATSFANAINSQIASTMTTPVDVPTWSQVAADTTRVYATVADRRVAP